MKPQEDIGSFIKTKLQSTEKPSNEETWDRIQSSLKERKKKKRFVFFLRWGAGIALLSIIGFFILNNNIDTSNTKQAAASQTDDVSISNSSKTENTHSNTVETNTNLDTDTSTLSS
jgi:cytoskeletal protein RodZ